MTGHIYLIRNLVNGKGYVGQTCVTIKKRYASHRSESQRGSECYLHRAMREYGIENFAVLEVASCEDADLLNDLEKHYIQFFGTFAPTGHGYNITEGGDSAPRMVRSKEHCLAISAAKKGCKSSPETRAKLSLARTGKPRKPHSEESKAKISSAKLGKKLPREFGIRMSERLRGNSNRLGKPHSEEVKARISLTMKARRAAQKVAR
jgi:group I intron endonuclease